MNRGFIDFVAQQVDWTSRQMGGLESFAETFVVELCII